MINIASALLGIGSWFKKNWKLTLAVILVVAGYFFISNMKQAAYDSGVEVTEKKYKEIIDAENQRNRDFEKKIGDIVSTFGEKAVQEALERESKTVIQKEKITEIVTNNPVYQECKIDQEVLDARNAVRELGPK